MSKWWKFALLGLPVAIGYSPLARGLDFFIENPQNATTESGIGLVSGWHCNAGSVQMQIDGGRLIPVPYGSERKDTIGECGDADNGFGFLLNYSGFGDGEHTINLYANGVQFASTTFQVVTLGARFLEGVSAQTSSDIFLPDVIRRANLSWSQAKQNFVVTSVQELPFTPTEMLGQILGTWSGEWTAPGGSPSGTLSLTLGSPDGASLAITAMSLTGTACAGPIESPVRIDPSPPLIETLVTFTDSSTLLLQGIPTASLQAFSGNFVYVSGACAGQEAVFSVF